ncbi:MAG: pilin [Oligoflexales bacterium]
MLDKKIFITVFVAVIAALFTYEKFYKIRYKQAAYISEGIVQATRIKNHVMEYYMTTGKLPSTNNDLGIAPPEQFKSESLVSLEVSKGGIITLTFDRKSGVKNGIIQFSPKVRETMNPQWACTTPSYQKISSYYPQCKYIENKDS